jgi:hypothetical protein
MQRSCSRCGSLDHFAGQCPHTDEELQLRAGPPPGQVPLRKPLWEIADYPAAAARARELCGFGPGAADRGRRRAAAEQVAAARDRRDRAELARLAAEQARISRADPGRERADPRPPQPPASTTAPAPPARPPARGPA